MTESERTTAKIVGGVDRMPLSSIVIDTLQRDGGTRQRPLNSDRATIKHILETGYDQSIAGNIVVFEKVRDQAEWDKFKKEFDSKPENKDSPAPKEPPKPLYEVFPRWKTKKSTEPRTRINNAGNVTDMKFRLFYVVDGNHRIWTLKQIVAKKLRFKSKLYTVPDQLHGVTLIYHDPENPACTAMTAIFCNNVDHATSADNYFDKLVATNGLLGVYCREQGVEWSKIVFSDAVRWFGARASTLHREEDKKPVGDLAKSTITLGVLFRTASMIPQEVFKAFTSWMDDPTSHLSIKAPIDLKRRTLVILLAQKNMSHNIIWYTPNHTHPHTHTHTRTHTHTHTKTRTHTHSLTRA